MIGLQKSENCFKRRFQQKKVLLKSIPTVGGGQKN